MINLRDQFVGKLNSTWTYIYAPRGTRRHTCAMRHMTDLLCPYCYTDKQFKVFFTED